MTEMDPAEARRRLRWRCRRGMRELDLLLQGFLESGYEALSEPRRAAFDALLGYPDAELLEWLMGRGLPLDKEIADVVGRIHGHVAS